MLKNNLTNNWVILARIGWVAMTLYFLITFVLGIPYRYRELVTPCDDAVCPVLALSSADQALIGSSFFSMEGYAAFHIGIDVVTALTMSVLAGLIFLKFFDNLMGIATAFFLIFFGLYIFIQTGASFAAQFPQVEGFNTLLNALALPLLFLVIFIFPNGRFLNNSSRWIFIISAVILAIDSPIGSQAARSGLGGTVFTVTFMFGIGSQIYRYRKSLSAVEKQQTKWVLLGIISLMFFILGWGILVGDISPSTPRNLVLTHTIGIAFNYLLGYVFPISMLIAVARYNLWGIELIIRRTLQYSLLTGLLALAFFGGIVVLQGVLGPLMGESDSPIVTVITTLGIAAIFTPLRRRVQEFIDRSFFRQKYDSTRALEQFAATARNEVDMEALQADLLRVVQDTMEPSQISFWVRKERA